ncbi:MAG: DUF1559 domain-containing protein, partial [Thermoguttaceae bacterium]|nr:DUF1559 domain-containing protein [Thermoguttaceae bacterium]
FANAYNCATGFLTVVPPNGPNCSGSLGPAGSYVAMPPSSYHAGGVNIAMADGSVRFVSDTINVGDPSASISTTYANCEGESPWGIWGAMGTINGGESVAL